MFLPTNAVYASFFSSYEFFPGEWQKINWNYFGGCEEGEVTVTCFDAQEGDSFFLFGDYNVKQGAYALAPISEDAEHKHGKYFVKYKWKFETEEGSDNRTDKGMMKIKDIDTNEVLYYKEVYPADARSDWKQERVLLPWDALDRRLQLVFEIEQDGERLSTLGVNTVFSIHKSQPKITGTVYKRVAGKRIAVENATVRLKNKKNTKVLKKVKTNENGDFTFFPVPRKKKFTIIARRGDLRKKFKTKRRLQYGVWYRSVDLEIK